MLFNFKHIILVSFDVFSILCEMAGNQESFAKWIAKSFAKWPLDKNFFARINNENRLRGATARKLAESKRLFLPVHLKLCKQGNVIFAR